VTAGSDAGVMRLVGQAIAKQDIELPLIGIFPWGVTNGRDRLDAAVGRVASYAGAPASGSGAPLNSDHTHFILVDNGRTGGPAWGSEIALRSNLEATIANTKNVPIVQLVVQGGPGTLATVEAIALEGKPVVVLTNSGGAATAIHAYVTDGISEVDPKFKKMEPKLKSIKKLHDAYDAKLLTFFSIDEETQATSGAIPDLSTSLLEAIVKMMKTRPDFTKLPEGAAVKHPSYGRGRITKVHPDGTQSVSFDDKVRRFGPPELVQAPAAEVEAAEVQAAAVEVELRHRGMGSDVDGDAIDARRVPTPDPSAPSPGGPAPTVVEAAMSDLVGEMGATTRPENSRGSASEMSWDSKSAVAEAEEEPLPPVEVWCTQETTVQLIRTPGGLVKFDPLLSKALGLTVVWDRPKLARTVLAAISSSGADEVGARQEVALALQRALELQCLGITEMLLGLPGIETRRVSMGRLYAKPDALKFLRNNRALQSRLAQNTKARPYEQELGDRQQQRANYDDFVKSAAPFYRSISPILSSLLRTQHCTQRHDVLFWLVAHGNEPLARVLWAECDLPIHMMLLAAIISQSKARAVVQGSAECAASVATYQEWARGAMECAPDEEQAHAVLELCVCGKWTAVDIAMHTSAKTFLSQKHCVSLIDRWWCGGSANSSVVLDSDFSWLRLTGELFCPLLNEDIRTNAGAKKGDHSHQSNLYDALGHYMKVAADERKAVRQLMASSSAVVAGAESSERSSDAKSPDRCSYRRHSTTAGKEAVVVTTAARRGGLKTVVEMIAASGTSDVGRKSALASFYGIPAVKFLIRTLFHAVVTLFYLLIIFVRFKDKPWLMAQKDDPAVAWSDKLPLLSDGSPIEVGWIMLELGIWLDRRHQHYMMSGNIALKGSSALGPELLSDLAFVVALSARIAMETLANQLKREGECCWPTPCDDECKPYNDMAQLYQVYQVIIGFKCMQICGQWFSFINHHEPLGILIIMIQEMVKDVKLFFYLFSVVTGAFMVAGAALQSADLYAQMEGNFSQMEGKSGGAFSAEGNFWSPFWLMFGFFEPSLYTWVSAPLAWIYSFICCIGMVNLLVAMFADTFRRVSAQAEVEFCYLECERMLMYRDVILSAPPLINCPYIAYEAFRYFARRCSAMRESYRSKRAPRARKGSAPPSRRSSARRASAVPLASQVEAAASIERRGKLERKNTISITTLDKTRSAIIAEEDEASVKTKLAFDGKLFVQAYIKKQNKLAADDPQAVAAAIRDNFEALFKQREEEFLATKRLFSTLEVQVESLKRKVDYARGTRVSHGKHGLGTVMAILPPDSKEPERVVVLFDKQEEHKYRPSSLHKLSLVPL